MKNIAKMDYFEKVKYLNNLMGKFIKKTNIDVFCSKETTDDFFEIMQRLGGGKYLILFGGTFVEVVEFLRTDIYTKVHNF